MLLNIFLFGVFFITGCLLISKSKNQPNLIRLEGQFSELTCLLEEAPESSLTGQFYPLQTPLLCLLEDIPEKYLRGQFYNLATPLMSPFACIVKQTWQKFYRQNLKQLGINYWEWRNLPEVENICEELSLLLQLPHPEGYVQPVLESIARNNNPFKTNFSQLNPILKLKMRLAFKNWHDNAIKLIGINKLKLIYQICYGTKWPLILKIINISQEDEINDDNIPWWEILGVSPTTKQKQVEIAYKKLIKTWHPDINQHPEATEITAKINAAYTEYKLLFETQSFRDSQWNNLNLFLKLLLDIFKPLLSQ